MSSATRPATTRYCDHCGDVLNGNYVRLEAFTKDKGGWWHPDLHMHCVYHWTMKMHRGEQKSIGVSAP